MTIKSLNWIFIFCFIFFLACKVISGFLLIRIKREKYRNLWEKDFKTGTIWKPYKRQLLYELTWKTPYWVEQEFDAKILIWIYRLSILFACFCWFLFILSKFRVIE
jgi:hypothetical protein